MPPILHTLSLFDRTPDNLPAEQFQTLIQTSTLRLERILSQGHTTAAGEWYDQEQDEWVALLQGAARLEIAGQPETIQMNPGDTLLIPARCRHRVAWTDPDQTTLWLALHFHNDNPA